MTPKEKLKEIYDEYIKYKTVFEIPVTFRWWLESIKYLDDVGTLRLSEECGFSTTSECRKAIKELENPNQHLEDSLNTIDKLFNEHPEKIREIIKKVKQNWNYQSVSDKITESTKNSEYTVYIPESAKKSEQQETWQDILDEFAKYGKGKLGDWLIENFEVPKRK